MTGATTVWASEIDRDAAKVIAARFPDAPNLGDFTQPGFDPPPVHVLTAGFPCQPFSQAGLRKGTEDDRWLWDDIAALVGRMDPPPRLLLFENVAGLLTVNGGHAMGRIVYDLARLGYLGSWRLVRASDVGCCHQRRRLFLAATLADTGSPGVRPGAGSDRRNGRRRDTTGPAPVPAGPAGPFAADPAEGGGDAANPDNGRRQRPFRTEPQSDDGEPADRPNRKHLPTPNAWDGARGPDLARANRPNSGGMDLVTTVERLLPTPTVSRGRNATAVRTTDNPTHEGTTLLDVSYTATFGDYADAISHHAALYGPAPPPTGTDGRLSPVFVEWMMGLDRGWVTDLGLSRTAQLRILGNGVVPAQAAHAYDLLIP